MNKGSGSKIAYKKCGFTLTMIAFIFAVSAGLTEASYVRPVFQKIAESGTALESKIRYGKNMDTTASMGKRKQDGILRLKVTMKEPDKLYLKSFCGTVYENGRWKENSERGAEESGLDFFLKLRKFYPELQLSKALQLTDDRNEIEIEIAEESRKYRYLPEVLAEKGNEEILKETTIFGLPRATGLFGSKHYRFRTIKTDYGKAWSEEALNALHALQENKKESGESREERLYREYVYHTCLKLPEAFEKATDFPLEKIGGGTPLEVVRSVETVTEKTADHFRKVSDAVLLLRYAGMPARYVEGYFVYGKEANQEIRVTDENLTAWAEVYLDGAGFVPVLFEEPYSDTEALPLIPENNENPEQNETAEKGILSETARKAVQVFPEYYLWSCLAAGLLTEAGMLFWLYRKDREKDKAEEAEEPSHQVILCEEMKRLLENYGISIDFSHPYACGEEIEKKAGKEMRDEVERVLYLIDKARFGKPARDY